MHSHFPCCFSPETLLHLRAPTTIVPQLCILTCLISESFPSAYLCTLCTPRYPHHHPCSLRESRLTLSNGRIPSNCAYTTQHPDPAVAQSKGASPTTGLGICNGGLQVVNPSQEVYNLILDRINDPNFVQEYDFADQSLLSDLFRGRWVALPYVYNALKTMRWKDVHDIIWQDENVKNVHFILTPKPWDEDDGEHEHEHQLDGDADGAKDVAINGDWEKKKKKRMNGDSSASDETQLDDDVVVVESDHGQSIDKGKDDERNKKEDDDDDEQRDETHKWWWRINRDRITQERKRWGIDDGF